MDFNTFTDKIWVETFTMYIKDKMIKGNLKLYWDDQYA